MNETVHGIDFARYLGAALAIGFSGLGSGFSEGYVAGKASEAISRQPAAAGEVVRAMLVTQAVTETAGIFGLLVAIMLLFVVPSSGDLSIMAAYVAAGYCMGIGAIGAGTGSGIAGGATCESVARFPLVSTNTLLNALIGQAISQTGAIFALVISLLLCLNAPGSSNIGTIGAMLGAGFSMGIGAVGAGAGSGLATARAVWGSARNTKVSGLLLRTMLLGQAVEHAGAIYAMIIAFLLLFSQQGL